MRVRVSTTACIERREKITGNKGSRKRMEEGGRSRLTIRDSCYFTVMPGYVISVNVYDNDFYINCPCVYDGSCMRHLRMSAGYDVPPVDVSIGR